MKNPRRSISMNLATYRLAADNALPDSVAHWVEVAIREKVARDGARVRAVPVSPAPMGKVAPAKKDGITGWQDAIRGLNDNDPVVMPRTPSDARPRSTTPITVRPVTDPFEQHQRKGE